MKGYQALPVERCGNCKHYREHYRRAGKNRYISLQFGHFVHPRLKNRRAEECCPHFSPKEEKAPRGQ